jgi:hypothetical protein
LQADSGFAAQLIAPQAEGERPSSAAAGENNRYFTQGVNLMSKRMIWIPVFLWLVTLAAFVGVAVLLIDKIDMVQTTAAEGAETVRYIGPHLHGPLSWMAMIFFGFLFVGFIMRMLFRPLFFFGSWDHHRRKHFGHRRRPPWWGEAEDTPSQETKDESAE